jgi:hypothetical protein
MALRDGLRRIFGSLILKSEQEEQMNVIARKLNKTFPEVVDMAIEEFIAKYGTPSKERTVRTPLYSG